MCINLRSLNCISLAGISIGVISALYIAHNRVFSKIPQQSNSAMIPEYFTEHLRGKSR